MLNIVILNVHDLVNNSRLTRPHWGRISKEILPHTIHAKCNEQICKCI